jgi:hypothetical protein
LAFTEIIRIRSQRAERPERLVRILPVAPAAIGSHDGARRDHLQPHLAAATSLGQNRLVHPPERTSQLALAWRFAVRAAGDSLSLLGIHPERDGLEVNATARVVGGRSRLALLLSVFVGGRLGDLALALRGFVSPGIILLFGAVSFGILSTLVLLPVAARLA